MEIEIELLSRFGLQTCLNGEVIRLVRSTFVRELLSKEFEFCCNVLCSGDGNLVLGNSFALKFSSLVSIFERVYLSQLFLSSLIYGGSLSFLSALIYNGSLSIPVDSSIESVDSWSNVDPWMPTVRRASRRVETSMLKVSLPALKFRNFLINRWFLLNTVKWGKLEQAIPYIWTKKHLWVVLSLETRYLA